METVAALPEIAPDGHGQAGALLDGMALRGLPAAIRGLGSALDRLACLVAGSALLVELCIILIDVDAARVVPQRVPLGG